MPYSNWPKWAVTNCTKHGFLKIEETYPSGKTRHGKPRNRCRKCRYESALKWRKENREKHLAQVRRYDRYSPKRKLQRFKDRLKKFGITLEQYEEIYKKQNGTCAICKNEESRLSIIKRTTKICVDHCHKTKKVRGLLCWKCNSMLGMADDSIPILENAIKYLSFAGS